MRPRRFFVTTCLILCVGLAIGASADVAAVAVWRNETGITLLRAIKAGQDPGGFWPFSVRPSHGQGGELPNPPPLPSRSSQSVRTNSLLAGIEGILRQDWQAAETDFQRTAAANPSDPLGNFWLGVVQYMQGKNTEARAAWAQADVVPFLAGLGDFSMQKGQYAEAATWYYDAIAVAALSGWVRTPESNLGQAYRNLGKLAWNEGHIDQASELYESALREMPDRTLFLYELAQLYVLQGRFDDAIALIGSLMRIEPNAASWPSVLGAVYRQSGQLDLAERSFLQSIQTGSDQNLDDQCWHARSWLELSTIYLAQQRWQDTVDASIRAVQENEGMNPAWTSLLDNNFERSLSAEPTRKEWYLAIATIYQQFGDEQSAAQYYQQAARRWPDDAAVQERLKTPSGNRTIAAGVCP